LTGILLGHCPCPERVQAGRLRDAADVLCWVLEHRHNQRFTMNLAMLEDFLKESGFALVEEQENG
jgi:hypothetical protein